MSRYRSKIERLEVRAGEITKQGPQPFTLPEMSIADYVNYFDTQRLPEKLHGIQVHLNYVPNVPLEKRGWSMTPDYLERQEQERVWINEVFAMLEEWYTEGAITADEYQRLTTPQNYSHSRMMELKKRLNYFIPNELGVGCKGFHVFYLRTGEGEGDVIWLRREGDIWIHDDDDPFQGKYNS